MNTNDSDNQFSAVSMNRQQVALTAQLFQAVASMHHIDELFQWLAYALVQRFNIQLLQFWTNHISTTGQLAAQLRTIARQDPSLPDQIVVNEQMQLTAQRLISERTAYNLQPVETIFSHYQAILLKRHGLSYWCACFTSGNALLPPRADILSQREPAFFAMTTLLFLRQSPQFNIVAATSAILDEATSLATKRGLLLATADPYTSPSPQAYMPPAQSYTPLPQTYTPPAQPYTPPPQTYMPPSQPYASPPQINTSPSQPYAPPPQISTPVPQFSPQEPAIPNQQAPLTLAHLIPKRKQDDNDLLSSNPFARPATISDKKARRLHAAINGQANVAELSSTTGLNMQETSTALRWLWDQKRIEVFGPGGKPVNLPSFLNDH